MFQLVIDNFETGKRDSTPYDDLESAIAQLEDTLSMQKYSVICYIFKKNCLLEMRFK